MATDTVYPEVAAAAKWWADQLRQVPKHDNGDGFQSILATYATMTTWTPIAPEKIDRFEAALSQRIMKMCLTPWDKYGPIVATDYGPDGILGDALEAAGIDDGNLRLPIKTVMWIDPGSVAVARGYGAEPVSIYPAPAAPQQEEAGNG